MKIFYYYCLDIVKYSLATPGEFYTFNSRRTGCSQNDAETSFDIQRFCIQNENFSLRISGVHVFTSSVKRRYNIQICLQNKEMIIRTLN